MLTVGKDGSVIEKLKEILEKYLRGASPKYYPPVLEGKYQQLQHNFVKLLDKEQLFRYTRNNSSGTSVPIIQWKVVEVKG